jgi:hypothetical protein
MILLLLVVKEIYKKTQPTFFKEVLSPPFFHPYSISQTAEKFNPFVPALSDLGCGTCPIPTPHSVR